MAVFGASIFVDLLVVISGCLFAVYATIAYLHSKWSRKGIPVANLHPIFGNIKDVIFGKSTFKDLIKNFYLEQKHKPFVSFFTFHQPTVMINDMELLKKIMIKDFSHFTDRNFAVSPKDPFDYYSMFALKGQMWRNLRSKLTPTFTSGKMKKMYEFVDLCGKELVNCMEREIGNDGDVEVKELFARFTTDVIATCAFGINGNSLKDPESTFRLYMRKLLSADIWATIVGFLAFLMPSLLQKLEISATPPDMADFFRKTVWDTVEYREKNKVKRNDFLGLLMELRRLGTLKNEDPLEEDEVVEESNETLELEGDKFVAQCVLFLAAGFETSSSTMSHALHEMALHPETQERVVEEIKSVIAKHDGKVTYDAVQEMGYLHMVVQETLRKYPILPMLDRQVTQRYRLPETGIELEVGDSVMIPVIGIHHDPELYPEPQRFDPERFSPQVEKQRPACSFLGFGEGPRNCIGMRMGWMQTKVGLIHTLLHYEATRSAKTKEPLEFTRSPFPQVVGGVPLHLKKRSA